MWGSPAFRGVTWHRMLSWNRLKTTPPHWDGMRRGPRSRPWQERNPSHVGREGPESKDWALVRKEVHSICLTKTAVLIINVKSKNLGGSCGVGWNINACKWILTEINMECVHICIWMCLINVCEYVYTHSKCILCMCIFIHCLVLSTGKA